MAKVSDPNKSASLELPAHVKDADTRYPKYSRTKPVSVLHELVFDRVSTLGWCIRTLQIRRARRVQRTERTYAIRCDTQTPVRIGNGPHVLRTVRVYVTDKNIARLQTYVDLQRKGEEDAHTIRDRISSRRAEGTLRRSRGETWWRWSS